MLGLSGQEATGLNHLSHPPCPPYQPVSLSTYQPTNLLIRPCLAAPEPCLAPAEPGKARGRTGAPRGLLGCRAGHASPSRFQAFLLRLRIEDSQPFLKNEQAGLSPEARATPKDNGEVKNNKHNISNKMKRINNLTSWHPQRGGRNNQGVITV